MRLALAQYRELAAFSQFVSDLDDATKKQLDRGQRVTELMKQNQYSPLSVAEMALSLFAANEGYFDDVEINKVMSFEKAMHEFARSNHKDLLESIDNEKELSKENDEKLKSILDGLVDKFSNN